MDNVVYIPVLNGGILNSGFSNQTINNKDCTFYTKNSIFPYSSFLLNPVHHKSTWEKVVEKDVVLKNRLLILDSGGLQCLTLGISMPDPVEIFKWQQQHGDIGFCMDALPFIPPKLGTNQPSSFSGWIFDKQNFLKYANKTKENIDATRPYKNDKFRFYGIIQGAGYNDFGPWYKTIRDDSYLDGYCVKSGTSPLSTVQSAVFAMENIEKDLHFLGTGNLSRSLIIYYMNKYINNKKLITFDSSSYDTGTQYRAYNLPFVPNGKIRFVGEENAAKDETLEKFNIVIPDNLNDMCDCEACRAIGNLLPEMVKNNDSRLGSLISLHNMILNIKQQNYVKKIVRNDDKIKEFVNSNFDISTADKILKAFDIIDLTYSRGSEYAFLKYKDELVSNKVMTQKTIFM